jgi:ABC-type branched-subunit amino acid transport system ATPase component/predicted MFS family arabinose efflux permease
MPTEPAPQDAATLVAVVLDEEARREAGAHKEEVVLPDDLLPGVGESPVTVRQALTAGGAGTVFALAYGRVIDAFELAAFGVLAPDIQRSLGVSDAVIGAIGGAFGILFLIGSIPLSTIADRYPRKLVAAVSMALWSLVVFAVGLVQNAFQLFLVRMATGLSQAHALPVNGPMLMDAYPIEARGRIFALYNATETSGKILGPVAVGAIAAAAGGDDGWRWAFFTIAVLGIPSALWIASLREPRRGHNEMTAVLGTELADDEAELPVSLGVAFERLRSIKTFHFVLLGLAILGFALFSIPLFLNLQLKDEFGLDAWERGIFGSLTAIPAIIALAVSGGRIDALFRRSPPGAVIFVGGLVGVFGLFTVFAVFMPNEWLVGTFWAVGSAFTVAAFSSLVAVTGSVIPYRLRSRGSAMLGVYIFLFGGFFGSVLTGLLSDAIGRRAAMTTLVLPSTLIGGALIAYGARYIRRDISLCVEELLEEREEAERVASGADMPAIQVRNLDFSYGTVQILFDVNLEVRKGETLALLGTNGAGKSTLLRVISGLGVATRGVIRLHGRTITYTDPEVRARIGIVQLMGGNALFPDLTVAENLRMAGFLMEDDELARRTAASIARFPALQHRLDAKAGELSGGQQQLLALAMALLHDPEVLIIDELTLGLAPVVVQEILSVVRRLKDEGQTMIIVEQSLNVALAIADRAIFMEKGQVRFDGDARELAERDDLARAVFLGGTT